MSVKEREELAYALLKLRLLLCAASEGGLRPSIDNVGRLAAPLLRPYQRVELVLLLGGLAAAAGIAFALRAYVAEVHVVLGSSMLPTFAHGDRVLVNKVAYGAAGGQMPKRGDVIVFAHGEGKDAQRLVKRIIGLPGDTIRMRGGFPQVNTEELASCRAGLFVQMTPGHGMARGQAFVEYLGASRYLTVVSGVAKPFNHEYTVGQREVFVLGDNREASNDSRFWNEGKGAGVPFSAIVGRVDAVLTRALPDGSIDLSRLLGEPALQPRAPGMDLSDVEAGIRACLREPSDETAAPSAVQGSTLVVLPGN